MKRSIPMKHSISRWMRITILTAFAILCLYPAVHLEAAAQTFTVNAVQESLHVEPSEANGLPAPIDVFEAAESGLTYQIFLPGSADPSACFLSWDGDMQLRVGEDTYTSGVCPVPQPGTVTTVAVLCDGQPSESFQIAAYQGSENVQPVFIDIDESLGTIAAMDGDPEHETSCSGRINIGGEWYDMPKIKGRGNWSWDHADDKRPYNISLGKKINFPGIDSEKTKKWTFLAEICDHSLLRNRTGFYLAHVMGVGQDTVSADVWINGEYQGCYTVTPKTDSFVPEYGYLIEEDNNLESRSVEEGGDPQFELEGMVGSGKSHNLITVKKMGDGLLMKDGVPDESAANQNAAAEEIRLWLQEAWDAIRSEDGFNEKGRYYTEYIDLESFAKMYLLQEYVKCYDVCSGSLYFHRDGLSDADKLKAGPLWDLDNALGYMKIDRNLGDLRTGKGLFIPNIVEERTSLYKTLGRHEDFMEEVLRQYQQNQAAFDQLEEYACGLIAEIEASAWMNHIKVNDLPAYDYHRYKKSTVLEKGTIYEQVMMPVGDPHNDWLNYTENLKSFIRARSLWFRNTDFRPAQQDQQGQQGNQGQEGRGNLSEQEDQENPEGAAGTGNKKAKKANPLKIKAKTVSVKYSKLKKKSQTLSVKKVIKFKKSAGDKKSYTITSVRKGKKSFKKYIRVNKKTGKITVKKSLKKGVYKVRLRVKAAGNIRYRAASETVTVTVKVK